LGDDARVGHHNFKNCIWILVLEIFMILINQVTSINSINYLLNDVVLIS